MTTVNVKGLSEFSRKFSENHISYPYSPTYLTNCLGDAIGKFNECMSLFDQIGCAVDQLYTESGLYFSVVAANYEGAEISNTLVDAVASSGENN